MSEPQILFAARRFRVVERAYATPDGQTHVREVIEHPGAAAIVPLLDRDHVLLIRNFRPAVGKTLLEIPAGTLEPNEDPRQTAERELTEETGYRAQTWECLRTFYMSPGILREQLHLYLATGLTLGDRSLDVGEQIEPEIVRWDSAMQMLADGEIEDAKTLVGLLLVDRLRKKSDPAGNRLSAGS